MLYPLLCLIVLFLSIVLWIYHWENPRCNGKLPPGSMGLPVAGESFQLFTLQYLRCFTIHQKENQQYGSLFKTSLVGRQIVVSTDTDVNRVIFQQKGKLVQSWYMDSFDDIVGKENMIYDFTVRKLFGCNNEKLGGCYSAFLDGLISFPLNIPGTAYWKCLQGRNKAMRVIKIMLEERRGTLTKKQDKDFLDVALEEMNKAGTILSEQTALDLLFALPFAAFESASSAVVLALQYLQSNPLALAELTQEHETILRERETKDSGITWKEYKSMTFTHMVINETIRLGNIVPTIFRKVVKDIEIKGRFKSNKPNSSMFNKLISMKINKQGRELNAGSKFFMGFGSVVRLCAGAEFVKLQISIFLHHLVTNYR
ncbi:hypothetical protein Goshw_026674 [Gossypium schwendimanii]|uniref:Cytochrome P450 87A3 n=1 Tax=Gossypium schwendimanii TaxID=34291 RepID=A0A7J9M082_GOSSC|nr:hypothetical protein [Gossypium schwendimanii]